MFAGAGSGNSRVERALRAMATQGRKVKRALLRTLRPMALWKKAGSQLR